MSIYKAPDGSKYNIPSDPNERAQFVAAVKERYGEDLDETSALEGTAVKQTATEGVLGATATEEGLVEGIVGAGMEAVAPLMVAGLTGMMIYDLIDPPSTPKKPPPPPTQTTIPSNIVNKYNLDRAILPTADAVVDSHSQLSPF